MIATGYQGPMLLEEANAIVEIAVLMGRTIPAPQWVPDLIAQAGAESIEKQFLGI